jgi:rhodanese-related sulfurtransferase
MGYMAEIEIDPREVKRLLDSGEKVRMLDVREPFEHMQAHIEGSELIPMRNVPQAVGSLSVGEGPLVVFCHHGVRSLQVVDWLRGQGIADCVSMAGGIDRWSSEIDPAVPRY